jgi:hypothetical protein
VDCFQQLETVHPSHFVVGDYQVEGAALELVDRFKAIGRGYNLEISAQLLKAALEH